MRSVILNKARNYSHNIYCVTKLYYHNMLCTLRNQHTLPSLFKLVTESILIFIAISTFLIVAMAL
jgi:hypothetical protein